MIKKKKKSLIAFLFWVLILFIILFSIPIVIKIFMPLEYTESIIANSRKYNLDPVLVAAVIKTESNFRSEALSSQDARGLMQITPTTGQWIAYKLGEKKFNEQKLYDADTNIRFGCWYIKYLYDYYDNDKMLAFAAYNGGIGNVDKWLNDKNLSHDGKTLDTIPYKETRNFVKRIDLYYKIYYWLYDW